MVRCWSILVVFLSLNLAGIRAAHAYSYVDDDDGGGAEVSARPYRIGVYAMGGGLQQGSKSFATSDQTPYRTSGYSGSTIQSGLFLDCPYDSNLDFRFYVSYQITNFHGYATEVGFPVAPNRVTINDAFVAGGGELKFKPYGKGFWYGVGAEFDWGVSLNLTLDGSTFPTTQQEYPSMFVTYGSVGWDITVSGDWIIAPEIRIGDAFFAKPGIFIYEAGIGIGRNVSF